MSKQEIISIENVCFSYNKNQAIDDISIALEEGRFYGIIGPNGCGKTTLLDLLTGNREPSSGLVRLYSKPLENYSKRELARQLALVPQEYDTGFGFSVEEVVLMGRHPHIPRFGSPSEIDWHHVDAAMEAIGISELRSRYTNTLSGGQKQRTVVARALAQNSRLLIFDEATSSLDIKYTLQIFNLVKRLVDEQNRTVIAVMHNLNLAAAYCDDLLIMKDGKIVSQGATDSTLTPEIIEKVFGVKSSIVWDELNRKRQVSFCYQQEI